MRFLRIRPVMDVTGPSRMTIYRLEIAGKFPRRRGNAVAWLEADIETWAKAGTFAHYVKVREIPFIAPAPDNRHTIYDSDPHNGRPVPAIAPQGDDICVYTP